jgi:hypothetical protein
VATEGDPMTKKQPSAICPYCNMEFNDETDIENICSNATDANACRNAPSKRLKFKPQIVGEDFERIEDNPTRLHAMQQLINDGVAWHPDIDQDGHIGRQANDLIARKLCKAPRQDVAQRMRHCFDVAQRFGIDRKTG